MALSIDLRGMNSAFQLRRAGYADSCVVREGPSVVGDGAGISRGTEQAG